jgi:ABC-type sugar transport system substrate-binding protein
MKPPSSTSARCAAPSKAPPDYVERCPDALAIVAGADAVRLLAELLARRAAREFMATGAGGDLEAREAVASGSARWEGGR